MDKPFHLSPTSLAQYIRLENCERFLRFRLVPQDLSRLEKKWNLTIQPLTPLLREAGADFEESLLHKVVAPGETFVDLDEQDLAATVQQFQTVRTPTVLAQPTLEAPIGDYHCAGRADLIRLTRDRQGQLHVLIADVKATRHEKTEHRVQVAAYARMIQNLAAAHAWPIAEIQGAILIQQEDGSYLPLGSETATFDLDTYLTILDRLVVMPDSVVNRIVGQPFESIFYHLNHKCDGCLYNSICMYDSAERMDIALTPQITAVEKRVLNEVGIHTIQELAQLLDLPAQGKYEMRPVQAHQHTLELLKNRWPVAPNLPLLVQRAQAASRIFDRGVDSRPFLYGSSFGNLPSTDQYPDLVKIFIDAQRDYLQDRLYLISAHVVGPNGAHTLVYCTSKPPTDESEGRLLIKWVRKLIETVQQLANDNYAPVHLYSFNRYDQNVLLEALKRHLSEVAAMPAFFDLLTQSPALTQPMITFLSDEVEERLNMGRVCSPLHDVARWRGFDWKDEKYEYYRLFRARMFDNRRDVQRLPDGRIKSVDRDMPREGPNRQTIEAASRFNSQIPLEYAYAAWGCLPEDKADSRLLEPFRAVNFEILTSFAAMRVQALAHIEASFKIKNSKVEKQPLNIPTILQGDDSLGLTRSLQEFLYIEHHTSLQSKLLIYSLPVDRRVQSGMAMLLRFSRHIDGGLFSFIPEFSSLGVDPVLSLNSCKLKEGDWVVMNPLDPSLSPNQIKHGRLAIVEKISRDEVILQLMGITFPNGNFRYFHKNTIQPEVNQFYTVDPMADELNADKMLDALANAQNNIFFEWLNSKPPARPFQQKTQDFYKKFADYVDTLLLNRKRKLTTRQREAISVHFDKSLLLVQGPPGTGKSYTLAWAVLAQIAAAAVQGKPCRVLISCKTHNAINVELEALAQAQAQVGLFAPPQIGGQALFGTGIYKIVNDAGDHLPAGVKTLNPFSQKGSLENLLSSPYIVIGATSGGAYNMMKYRELGGKFIDWNTKTFDLVVIDEASQMSLPEGVLASAFLKHQGQMIVVGDHRQMPPIIAHPWKDEQKRSVAETRPFISLFEALEQRGFPCVRLDESFRLHYEIAEFLRENIYSKDGINFHSKRKDLINQLPHLDQYVDAVLQPNYPIVVIEHTEQASQQYNPVELALVKPLIQACVKHLSLDGRSGIGIVVPHRAQKALLRAEYPDLAEVNSIDTVERFQGDERDVIIVSATASDPDYVRNEADFLLNLNRLNVAISRPRKKLIVIASRSVIDLLTSDLEIFEQSVIWKRLYHHYTPDILYQSNLNGYQVNVRGRKAI
jgi:hypothetical protein